MNDFTKEELQEIYSHLENEPLELQDKIQSMINDYDVKVIECWHCEKCGHIQ